MIPLPGRSPRCASNHPRRCRASGSVSTPEAQRRPRERPADREHRIGRPRCELLGDVLDHALVRRRGGREHGHAVRQGADELGEPPVVGAEVVPTVRDAVRLVHDEHAHPGDQRRQLLVAEPRVVEPLGGDQQDVDLVAGERGLRVRPLVRVRRVDRHRATPARPRRPPGRASGEQRGTRARSVRHRADGAAAVARKYTADLPHPVRCTTRARCRCSTSAEIASSCPGWNTASGRPVRAARAPALPQRCRRTAVRWWSPCPHAVSTDRRNQPRPSRLWTVPGRTPLLVGDQ